MAKATQCPSCDHPNPGRARFCMDCGLELVDDDPVEQPEAGDFLTRAEFEAWKEQVAQEKAERRGLFG